MHLRTIVGRPGIIDLRANSKQNDIITIVVPVKVLVRVAVSMEVFEVMDPIVSIMVQEVMRINSFNSEMDIAIFALVVPLQAVRVVLVGRL